jgi:hypothetical protein
MAAKSSTTLIMILVPFLVLWNLNFPLNSLSLVSATDHICFISYYNQRWPAWVIPPVTIYFAVLKLCGFSGGQRYSKSEPAARHWH